MSNIDSLIAVVKDELGAYDVGNVLDEDSMYRRIVLALKGFGNDITVEHEDVVRIREGKGRLPKNFYNIKSVQLCCPINYDRHGHDIEIHHVIDTQFYNLIHEIKNTWDSCDDCCKEQEAKVYRKELIYKENRKVTCNYEKGKHIRLVKGFIRNECAAECLRLTREDCHEEVSIVEDMMLANFNEGDVYIRYRGFLQDEKGDIILPETPNGNLEQYLEYDLKSKMAERLLGNEKATALSNLMPLWLQMRKDFRHNAQIELKMKSLQPDQLQRKIQYNNRRDFNRKSSPGRIC